jgi:ubiquinone/menaquinone biosynthesis C-methylase UbiE
MSGYTDNTYWEDNETFHEEDAGFKAECAHAALAQAGVALSGKRIFDVGCGSGKFLSLFAAGIEATFTGLDVSPAAIERANGLHVGANVSFRIENVAALPDDACDIAICNDVFEHVEDYIGFLRELRRVAPVVYFNIPLDMTVLSVLCHSYMAARKSVGHLHYFSARSAVATLEDAGFTIMARRYNSTLAHNLRTHRTLRNTLAALPRWLLYAVNMGFGVHLLGGASLGVVCGR